MMLSDTSFESTKHIKSRQIACPPNRQTFCEIEKIAKNYQPDIIHMIGGGNRMIAAVNKLGEQFKCIITIHNVPPYERSACCGQVYPNTFLANSSAFAGDMPSLN